MKHLFTLFLLFFIYSCQAQTQQPLQKADSDNSLLWQVSGNGLTSPSYLFGTFHLLCKEDVHFSDQLKTAIERSDTVYMEMKMDDPAMLAAGMMYMSMKDGKTLKDLYTEAEYQRLDNFFKDSLKMPLAMLQSMKPYFLVAMFYPRMMDCATPSGVEMELMKIIKEGGKEIRGLETIQFQASVFDSIPYEWQAKELLKGVDSLAEMKKQFNQMVGLYKNQRLDSLSMLMGEGDFSNEQYGAFLLGNRNRNWVSYLHEIMGNQSVFVAVGAGHLPGEDGMIVLLRELGYEVVPLRNE